MNDLYDAIQKSIEDYVRVDALTPRKKQRLLDAYKNYVYDYETVKNLLVEDEEESD